MQDYFRHCRTVVLLMLVWLSSLNPLVHGEEPTSPNTSRGDRAVAEYFRIEATQLRDACLADVKTIEDWKEKQPVYRQELLEMLGLFPLPPRTDLQATITGKVEHPEFTVEKLHFQSSPGLYVTANLYIPKKLAGPAPTILYVCGHGKVAKDGVSYGNKVHYQHHGGWLARNGYVCLIIDTLQLGEIEGIHHGTYNYNRWWWLSRGYTPAGVEAWNCIRALDYLETRPEVDAKRFGVSGRSGGGAYSWWISAIDERIQAAVPVAGITDLQNHVVDGVVEGHCDCMFMVNTFRWDYPLVAALNYPRPLLISNTDRDGIFPLDGVYRTYVRAKQVYDLSKLEEKIALNITAGGHVDTQELQIHAIRWFDKYLHGEERLIENAAQKFFEPEQLRVFTQLPPDQINTRVDEVFVPQATLPEPVKSPGDWEKQREAWLKHLREKSFRAWPEKAEAVALKEAFSLQHDGLSLKAYDFTSQPGFDLRLYLVQRDGLAKPELVVLNPLDQPGWVKFLATMQTGFEAAFKEETLPTADPKSRDDLKKMLTAFPWAMAFVAPRGVGPTLWDQTPKKQTQHRRRFYLLGQTWEGMQAWDIRRAMQAVRAVPEYKDSPLWLQGERDMAVLSVYASLFEPPVTRLDLHGMPLSHATGPALLNVLKAMDIPQALTMAGERSRVVIYRNDSNGLEYLLSTAKNLGWPEKQIQVRPVPGKE